MTYTIVAFIKCKDGITLAEFCFNYETVYILLAQSIFASAFPLTHTRNYVTRNLADSSADAGLQHDDFIPTLYNGQPADVNYDCVSVMVWEDKAAFDRFNQIFFSKEVSERLAEVDKCFFDRNWQPMYALDEPVVTKRA